MQVALGSCTTAIFSAFASSWVTRSFDDVMTPCVASELILSILIAEASLEDGTLVSSTETTHQEAQS